MKKIIMRLDTNDVYKGLEAAKKLFINSEFEVAVESNEISSMSGHVFKEYYLRISRTGELKK